MHFPIFKKKLDDFDYETSHDCKNCAATFQGKFCNRCGEKVIDVSDRSFVKMAESLLNAFTFLEGKFWRSFKLTILYPGKLASEIRSGIQVPYMKLVGMFFVANFFYFLFPVFDTFNSSLHSQLNYQSYSNIVQDLVNGYVKANNISIKEFAQQYNSHSSNLAKLLLVFLVFIFTVPLSIINYSKKNLYFDHLQISFEFHAFQLLVCSVVLPNVIKLLVRMAAQLGNLNWEILLNDTLFSYVVMIFFLHFWIRAQHSFYHHNWLISLLKGGVLAYLVIYSWSIYRMILFFVTFYSL